MFDWRTGYQAGWRDAIEVFNPNAAVLARIERKMDRLLGEEDIVMAVQQDIKDALDKVTADVAAQTTIAASMKVYVKGINDKLIELANATKDTTTAQALQALATQIEVNTKSDADAMVANTGGSDTVNGGAGNDTINGGLGNDTIGSFPGSTVSGGLGNDSINSGLTLGT